jgi:hypothetical protein
MFLAYQLSVRLDSTGWYWLNLDRRSIADCVTGKVTAAVLLSQQWIPNVSCTFRDGVYTLHSSVVKSQMEGLVKFAEELRWPYLRAAKNYSDIISQAVPSRLNRMASNPYMWDWLYGLALPGSYFSHKIMLALVIASEKHSQLGLAPALSFGLVLEDRSYWRQSSVLGRVLAGLKDVKAVSGWIGPCPSPKTTIDSLG